MTPKNRMRAIRSYGTVGVPAGNRRHYPELARAAGLNAFWGRVRFGGVALSTTGLELIYAII